MAKFLSLARFMDGGAADEYYWEWWVLLHVVSDDRFASFLSAQPAKIRESIGVTLSSPGDTNRYRNRSLTSNDISARRISYFRKRKVASI